MTGLPDTIRLESPLKYSLMRTLTLQWNSFDTDLVSLLTSIAQIGFHGSELLGVSDL
jgi:hypothetical protein